MLLDLFLVRPGDGEQFVYSPVDVNATLHCAVNNTYMSWIIDQLSFEINDNSYRGRLIKSRGIFQSKSRFGTITESSLTVDGDINVNNGTLICCQSLEEEEPVQYCTTLIIYGMFI